MRGATQVLSDCPHCHIESALCELLDPGVRLGVAIEGRCRMCGYATELGDVVQLGQPFLDEADVVEALGRWAVEDGEADVHVFAAANFNGRDPGAIARAVLAGERVDTGFDVIAWLFPGLQGGRHPEEDERRSRVGAAMPRATTRSTPLPLPAPLPKTATRADTWAARRGPTSTPDPRDIGRALASVMLADGRIRPGEQRFLDAALARLGLPPLEPADLRVWRPTELGPVPDPAGLLETMRLLALCDHELDGSEQRLLQEFARAWRVPLQAGPLPRPGAMYELGRALRGLLVQ